MDKFMQDYAVISGTKNPDLSILLKRQEHLNKLKTKLQNAINKAVMAQIIDELEKLEYEYAVLENMMRMRM